MCVGKKSWQFHFLQFNLLIYMRGPAGMELVFLQRSVAKNGKEVFVSRWKVKRQFPWPITFASLVCLFLKFSLAYQPLFIAFAMGVQKGQNAGRRRVSAFDARSHQPFPFGIA